MNENTLLIVALLLLVVGFAGTILLLFKKLSNLQNSPADTQTLGFIQNQINTIATSFDSKLTETNKIINDQLQYSNQRLHLQNSSNNDLLQKINENNSRILQEVTQKLTSVESTNQQVVQFAQQLKSLENILSNPKQRGVLGEYFLETMLGNVLPQSVYKMQYPFKDGIIVDAVININDKIIPIDAKFSLEGYNRIVECIDQSQLIFLEKAFILDVKKRIDEVSKYILPEENTINMAFMFVPADGVYNEIIKLGNSTDIVAYAYSKKVVLVSPTSFFAYLQTVIQALNMMKVEEKVLDIVKYLNESTKYLKQFEENMSRLGKNIGTVINTYNSTNSEARKLSTRISKITNNKEDLILIDPLENNISSERI